MSKYTLYKTKYSYFMTLEDGNLHMRTVHYYVSLSKLLEVFSKAHLDFVPIHITILPIFIAIASFSSYNELEQNYPELLI